MQQCQTGFGMNTRHIFIFVKKKLFDRKMLQACQSARALISNKQHLNIIWFNEYNVLNVK